MHRRHFFAGLALGFAGCLRDSRGVPPSNETTNAASDGAPESFGSEYDCDEAHDGRYRAPSEPVEELEDRQINYYIGRYESTYVRMEMVPEDGYGSSLQSREEKIAEQTDDGVLVTYTYTYSYNIDEGDQTAHLDSSEQTVRYFLTDEFILRTQGEQSAPDPRNEGNLLTCFD